MVLTKKVTLGSLKKIMPLQSTRQGEPHFVYIRYRVRFLIGKSQKIDYLYRSVICVIDDFGFVFHFSPVLSIGTGLFN